MKQTSLISSSHKRKWKTLVGQRFKQQHCLLFSERNMENRVIIGKRYVEQECFRFLAQNPQKADPQACQTAETFNVCPVSTLEMSHWQIQDPNLRKKNLWREERGSLVERLSLLQRIHIDGEKKSTFVSQAEKQSQVINSLNYDA